MCCSTLFRKYWSHLSRYSDESSPWKDRSKVKIKSKKAKKESKHEDSSDSSVEIVHVKLPYQDEIDKELNKPTQELDTLAMWDRLIGKEKEKEIEKNYDAE